MTTRRAVLFTLVLLTSACGRASQAPPAPVEPAPPAAPVLASLSVADLDAFISATVAAQHAIGVNVGVMKDGQVIFAKGYGLARVADKTPVATETLFAIGSVTKQFTCAVALQLEQEKKLSFADTVARYEPGLTRARDITLADIGGMVSGYRDYYPLDFVDRPMAAPRSSVDIVREFASRPLDFEPRARYSYSNTGYLLLGAIAERAGREPFAAQLERRLFAPLGLTHTRYEPARGV
jgi:D-alanyl-D-alanine carboxypeptidase